MRIPFSNPRALAAAAACGTAALLSACGPAPSATAPGLAYSKVADYLHMVLENDRTVYTQKVVNRLVKTEQVIKASEHWSDEKALPLPAQMFRMGAELTAEKTSEFSYSLQSLWPINKANAAGQTAVEKEGLEFVAANGGSQPYYGEETLAGQKFFVGVYADVAVAPVCIDCHNGHKDSPRTDFKLGEVMGGVVIRIPVED